MDPRHARPLMAFCAVAAVAAAVAGMRLTPATTDPVQIRATPSTPVASTPGFELTLGTSLDPRPTVAGTQSAEGATTTPAAGTVTVAATRQTMAAPLRSAGTASARPRSTTPTPRSTSTATATATSTHPGKGRGATPPSGKANGIDKGHGPGQGNGRPAKGPSGGQGKSR